MIKDILDKDDNNNIKLSIAIPTYNGAKHIREALDSIISQLNDINEKIEILVSDNASSDGTEEIIKQYMKKYSSIISYYKNDKNVGFDKNIDLLFKRAKGEYVWPLSDDDTLKRKSLLNFFNKLNKYKCPSVLFLNYSECDKNMNECLHRYRLDIYEDVYCKNGDMFFQESKFLFGLISSLIIKKLEWNSINIDKYINSGWVHVGAIIEILINQPSVVISDKLVNLRMGNSRWGSEGTFLYLGINLVKLFQGMENLGYEKKTYEYLIDNVYRTNLKAVLKANSEGLKNKKDVIVNMIECYKRYPLFWLIHLPLLLLPNQICKIMRLLYSVGKKGIKELKGEL